MEPSQGQFRLTNQGLDIDVPECQPVQLRVESRPKVRCRWPRRDSRDLGPRIEILTCYVENIEILTCYVENIEWDQF